MYHFHGITNRKEVKTRLKSLILITLACLTPSLMSTGLNSLKNKEKIAAAYGTDITEASSSNSGYSIRNPEDEIVEVKDLSYRSKSDDLPLCESHTSDFA